MFKSKELNESQFLNNVPLPRMNDTCNGKPQITSTPINSLDLRRKSILSPPLPNARHASPRKYSLSEVGAPSSRIDPKPTTSNAPGPLLASLSIKDNVSMYQETKSSGLARRIVQYKEKKDKKNEKHYTHQEQYSSPGLFPIVHLFRKKLPARKLKPERIMPRMSSPEYLKSLSPMINKNLDRSHLLDNQTRPRYPRPSSFPAYNQNGVETKSVLEALKEISRKRIRSSEEYETLDTGKKAKTDSHNGVVATTKRTRVDSPPLNSSSSPSSQQSQKKFCNEFDASKSSSDFTMLKKIETPKSSKRKTTSTSTESLDNTKQVKVVAVETQTPITLPNIVEPKEKSPEIVEETVSKELPVIEKPKAKLVFNDVFMDNYRGKRLLSLMGSDFKKNISVKEPEKPATVTKEQTEVQSSLTSILSSPKSSTHKPTEKHVHFNETTAAAPSINQPSLTQTSAPIVSESVSKPSIIQTTPVASTTPTFSFGNPTSTDKTDTSKPSVGLGKPLETSPQKLGGFKFDLNAPASTTSSATKTTLPSISFPANALSFNKPSESSVIVFGSSSNTTTAASTTSKTEPTFSFGNSLAKSPAINFGSNAKTPSFKITTTPSTVPAFGITSTTTTSAAPMINFGVPAATTTTTPSVNFGGTFGGQSTASNKPSTASPSMFGSNTSTATVTPTFGSPQVSKPSTGFGSGNAFGSNTTTISAPTFGNNTTTISLPTFGNNTTTISAPTFGNTTTISAPTFGNTTTISAPTFSNTTSVFGTAPVTSAPVFGSGTTTKTFGNTTSSVFGTPATAASVFGATSSPAPPTFGSTTSVFGSTPATPMFGSTTTTTSASMFGSTTTTTSAPPTFGSTASGFGSTPATSASVFSRLGTKPTSAFGGTQTTAAPVFGATNSNPTFGSKNSVFGASSAQAPPPAYGTPSANNTFAAFGTTTANGPFGGTTTTTSATGFGAISTFSFGGSKPVTANPFGTTTTTTNSTFGTANAFAATTKSSSTFGSPSAFSSTAGGFGASAPTFGAAANTFGGTSAPSFGQKDNKAPFAFGGGENKTNTISFGSGTANNTQTGFGSSATSGFGTAPAAQPQSNGGFNFGSNTSAAPFAFGGATTGTSTPAKPGFNFGGSTNPPPAFGNPNSMPTFGTASLGFAAPGAPTFSATGTPGAGAGVFNIGTGSTGGRPRTQLRAKRRT
ncbi:unnamed protein product [Ceutorhynchus assimilis]|uniref:Uncharacterized protein n=1 Tax=Ceutorhynchus assimilis TaxID=467358 RepID=A0A9N9MYS2_9CUCU|nr:unnamed protein product [Ceutorhynchus assimilis]